MSKYKLINKTTGEEHLCDKVTIEGVHELYYRLYGFDYYVSDEIQLGANNVWVATKSRVFKFKIHMAVVKSNMPRIIIATNNPNIDDIPKVVDEVERLANEFGYHDQKSDTLFREGLILGYNKSQETHPFSEEDVRFMLSESFKASHEGYQITSDEIIQLWKEQQPKTLYYE